MFERGGPRGQSRIDGIGLARQRAFEGGDHGFEAIQRAIMGGAKRAISVRAQRRDNENFVPDRIENHHHGRAQHQRVRHANRIWLCFGKALHLADHIVAEIAEDARRHRGEIVRGLNPRFGDEFAQSRERRPGARCKTAGIGKRAAIDLGFPARNAPENVGIEADHREAASRGAAFDGFKQKNPARTARR